MIDVAWAQSVGGGGGPGQALVGLAPLIAVFGVFYFLLIRPQQQKQKEHEQQLANLKKNDEVVTAGGLYGKVVALEDHVVTVEIASNVKVKVARVKIDTVVLPEEKSKENNKGTKS